MEGTTLVLGAGVTAWKAPCAFRKLFPLVPFLAVSAQPVLSWVTFDEHIKVSSF